jgi:hypothetical protein
MRKIFSLALVLAGAFLFALCFPETARAQFTTVTATVTDPNGIPYAGGTMSAVLVPGASGGYKLGGQPYSGRVGPLTLDSTGSFTANFGDVTLITPGSPQWQITIDSNPGGIPPPLGTGGQTFVYTSTGTTISGSSPVSLSVALTALAPKLTNFAAGSGTVTNVTGTSPIVSSGGATPAISCPTCNTSGATISGSIATNQVAFGTASNTIGGSGSILWTPSSLTGTLALANLTAATGGANQSGPTVTIQGTYWTGAASATDTFTIADQVGVGTNPGTTLNFSHAGSSPGGSYNFSGPVNVNAALTSGQITTGGNSGINFTGGTSGVSGIKAANVAGTPATWNLPSVDPTAGQVLSSAAPSGGNSILSWVANPLGINSTSPSLPFGTDTGAVNAYVVNPTPAVTLTAGPSSCFNWTTTNVSTGASTMNASGTGVKNLKLARGTATVSAGNIASGVVYEACYDSVQWLLNGIGSSPSTTVAAGNGNLLLTAGPTVGATDGPLTIVGGNPGAITSMITFVQGGSGNAWYIDNDVDGVLVFRSSGATYDIAAPWEASNQFALIENITPSGDDIAINPSPGGAKTSGNAISVKNNSGPVLFNIDSVTGRPSASGSDCASAASPAVCGGSWTGNVVIAAAGTTITVNTTAVTANSQIFLTADDTVGTRLSVTCNSTLATLVGGLAITARTAGTSFQITSGVTPAVNPLCISYHIVN